MTTTRNTMRHVVFNKAAAPVAVISGDKGFAAWIAKRIGGSYSSLGKFLRNNGRATAGKAIAAVEKDPPPGFSQNDIQRLQEQYEQDPVDKKEGFMVWIPATLLQQVDDAAIEKGLSRNQFVRESLQRAVSS